jgi:ribulose-phosphate 3-epimerase
MLAQQIIRDEKRIRTPRYEDAYSTKESTILTFNKILVEEQVITSEINRRPDCIGISDDHDIWIEIKVTHEVDKIKQRDIQKENITCLEVDLSDLIDQDYTRELVYERLFDKNRYRYMKRIVAPSILSADFGNLERDTLMLNRSEAEWVHVDVMDGQFVPNISFGFPVLKAVTKVSTKVIDTHLMIVEPIRYVEQFAKAGSDYVTFHLEAASDVKQCIDAIHNAGAKAGISIKPATPVSALEPYIDSVDMVLIMSVEPGFGGQSFIPESLDKARLLRAMIEAHNTECIIEMDGGISADNAAEVFAAGVDAIVAGSAVFNAEEPEAEIVKILNA